MPWPQSSVPKFGNWDKNEDLSYSIVFDQVRAEKESSLHSLDGDFETVLSPKSDGRTANRASQSYFPNKIKGKREKFLHTAKENVGFARSHHHSAFRRSEETKAGNGTFQDINRSKDFGLTSPKLSSSWQAAVLRDHQNVGSQKYFNHLPADSIDSHMVSSAVSSEELREFVPIMKGQGLDQGNKGYWVQRPHTKLPGLGRHVDQEGQSNAKAKSPRQSFDKQEIPTVPKFGDWEHGDGFTTIFNNVRKERNSKHTRKPIGVAPFQMDEDLYEGSERIKHRRSWLSIFSCFKSHL